jgi:hypothetical protein
VSNPVSDISDKDLTSLEPVPGPCHRKVIGIEYLADDAQRKNYIEQWDTIAQLFASVGNNIICMIVLLLVCNPDVLRIVLQNILRIKAKEMYSLIHRELICFADSNNIAPDKNWILRAKDELLMSNMCYFLFTNKLGLTKGYLPCKTMIQKHRQALNEMCVEEFETETDTLEASTTKNNIESAIHSICAYANPITVLHYLCSPFIGNIKLATVEVKFSFDGAAKVLYKQLYRW